MDSKEMKDLLDKYREEFCDADLFKKLYVPKENIRYYNVGGHIYHEDYYKAFYNLLELASPIKLFIDETYKTNLISFVDPQKRLVIVFGFWHHLSSLKYGVKNKKMIKKPRTDAFHISENIICVNNSPSAMEEILVEDELAIQWFETFRDALVGFSVT